ncbi:MAG: DUF4358 domain-containing protein, partial [Firmicutes bacterium]|nr:DUF4358 domain-containing protein [Bacillota bacterium]
MEKKRGVLKVTALAAMIVAIIAVMSACGGSKSYELDEVKLAGRLLSEVQFDCELYQVKDEKVENFIDLEGAEKEIMYMGSGSYADSFGIFSLDTEENAEAALEVVNAYLADLQDSFKDYIPEEADKIQKATAVQKGKFVVFCITSDAENAAAIIDESFVEVSGEKEG